MVPEFALDVPHPPATSRSSHTSRKSAFRSSSINPRMGRLMIRPTSPSPSRAARGEKFGQPMRTAGPMLRNEPSLGLSRASRVQDLSRAVSQDRRTISMGGLGTQTQTRERSGLLVHNRYQPKVLSNSNLKTPPAGPSRGRLIPVHGIRPERQVEPVLVVQPQRAQPAGSRDLRQDANGSGISRHDYYRLNSQLQQRVPNVNSEIGGRFRLPNEGFENTDV